MEYDLKNVKNISKINSVVSKIMERLKLNQSEDDSSYIDFES